MKFCVVLFALLAIGATTTMGHNLNGHLVYRVHFAQDSQVLELFNEMFETFDKIFWLYVDENNKYAEIVIAPKDNTTFITMLQKLQLKSDFLYEINETESSKFNDSDMLETDRKSYRGYKVYHVTFETEEQFQILFKMQVESGTGDISFWQLSRSQKYADIMVAPTKIYNLVEILKKDNFTYRVMIEDVEEHIEKNQ